MRQREPEKPEEERLNTYWNHILTLAACLLGIGFGIYCVWHSEVPFGRRHATGIGAQAIGLIFAGFGAYGLVRTVRVICRR
jgi:hypothetical protein